MSRTWYSAEPPPVFSQTAGGRLRLAIRLISLMIVIFGGLAVLLTLRLIERPIAGQHRPITPYVTQGVCKMTLRILGLKLGIFGTPYAGREAVVANHSSWLDIFVLNASMRVYFVSKAEVAGWPGIGWLARATGTVFIERHASQAAAQAALFQSRLLAGHKLLFFPEGTSTDGEQVVPFRSTLFQPFFAEPLREVLSIQPVSIAYTPPQSHPSRIYGWWGGMEFAPHLLQVLSLPSGGSADVVYHASLAVAEFSDRKTLAKACENAVREGHARLQMGGR
ncbi:MAG: lysophospholipid acyltransferase family protein [Pseudomonadota bacterium]